MKKQMISGLLSFLLLISLLLIPQPAVRAEESESVKNWSSMDADFDHEYLFQDFNAHSENDKDRQNGVETFDDKDIVFEDINYEQLIHLLQQEGNFLIQFSGSWCHNSRAMSPYINQMAHEYGIDTIYMFDFNLSNTETGETFVRMTNGKGTPGTLYNYLYGEVISRFLTNCDDWVENPADSESPLTYTNAEGKDVTVARLQQPFIFLYNKDNTKDYSGKDVKRDTYPIVYAYERMVDRDDQGVYVTKRDETGEKVLDEAGNPVREYITEDYEADLKKFFDFIKEQKIEFAQYTDADFIRDSYVETDEDGKTEPLFKEDEPINFDVITYRQLKWLLEQPGDSLIFFGGSWCFNTAAVIRTINDLAVKNNLKVYLFDMYLDGNYSVKEWGYPNSVSIRYTGSPFVNMYTDLIEQYFTNITTKNDVNDEKDYGSTYELFGETYDWHPYIAYTDESGKEVHVNRMQIPYFLAYNKDAEDEDGFPAPVLGYSEEMYRLDKTAEDYIYDDANFKAYMDTCMGVFESYGKSAGEEIKGLDQD